MKTISGTLTPINDNVIVTDMEFKEQVTRGGIILPNDDGTTRGIYPRWARVYKKGPKNKEPYQVGDWILIEHGRWTRGIAVNEGDGENVLRMAEVESIIGWAHEKPSDTVQMGKSYENGESTTIPTSLVNG